MLRESYVGALYTRRHARGGDIDTLETAGIDFRLQTSTFRGSSNLRSSGYFLHTTNPLGTGKNSAFGGEIVLPERSSCSRCSRLHGDSGQLRCVGWLHPPDRLSELRPEAVLQSPAKPAPLDPAVPIREQASTGYSTRRVTARCPARSSSGPSQLDLHSQDTFEFSVIPTYEFLEEDFEISDDITLPAGSAYNFTRYRVEARTARSPHTRRVNRRWSGAVLLLRRPAAPRRDGVPSSLRRA